MFFPVLVYIFNFNLFEFSAAILEKGLLTDALFLSYPCSSNNVDHHRMRNCLMTETETLLHLSGVKRISLVYFGGG